MEAICIRVSFFLHISSFFYKIMLKCICMVGDKMIAIERTTIDGKKYVIYLPNDKSNTLDIRFSFDIDGKNTIKNNEVLVQLSKDMQEKDILDAIKNSMDEIINRGYNVKREMFFDVNSEEELQKINAIINLGFNDIIKTTKGKGYYDEKFKAYLTVNTIQKMDNGRIVNYVIAHEDDVNREFVLAGIDVNKMEIALEEILNDDTKRNVLEGKSPEDIANIVLNYIADRDNLKRYMLEENSNTVANDLVGSVTQNVATQDDKVNMELGIIKNDVKDKEDKSYQMVSVDGESYSVSEFNPGTINTDANGNRYNNTGVETISHVEEQNEDIAETFYIDDEGNLYDKDGNVMGNINYDSEYQININDNSLYKDGKKIGVIDDYRALGVSQEKSQENVMRRVLLPNNTSNNGIIRISIIGVLLGISLLVIFYLIVR